MTILMATVIGTVTYVWLTVSVVPLFRGLRATLRSMHGSGWRYALPLSAAVSALAAAIAAASAMLMIMWAPQAGALLADGEMFAVAALAGAFVWCARAASFGVPRLGPDLEMALALAVIALKSDDAALLTAVEREYAKNVIVDADRYVTPVASTVLGV